MSGRQSPISNLQSRGRWLALGVAAIFLLLVSVGWWRGTGVGPQVQVPMFYDAHYLFPRPWTQEQEAPGVPDPAPVTALYGANRLSQPFVAGADRLSLLEVWLAGPAGTPVQVSLQGEGERVYGGEVVLDDPAGRTYRLSVPTISDAKGQRFVLTLVAPQATADRPVTTRAVGGDRLGASIHLNEYPRPGNLALYTYARGLPGRWWVDALAEQILPSLFRLRLQQLKPDPFKGAVFPLLLAVTVGLTALFLVLARPGGNALTSWFVGLLVLFLGWQVASGRVLLPGVTDVVPLQAQTDAIPVAPELGSAVRLAHDFPLTLWTADRLPEARFVATDFVDGTGAIRVPARSALDYALTVPLHGRLRAGVAVEGEGQLRFSVRLGGQEIHGETVAAGAEPVWLNLDLAGWGGQGTALSLVTEPVDGQPEGLWLMPQLVTKPDWLPASVPDDSRPAGQVFAGQVELVGYMVDPVAPRPGEAIIVTLYWRARQPTDAYGTVFVHLLDENGDTIAQDDAGPVAGTYPVPVWQPGTIVADAHTITLPQDAPAGGYTLAVGLYDPATLDRWPATAPDGTPLPDNRALLPTFHILHSTSLHLYTLAGASQ